ncbi:hypothetical protein ABIE61_001152 [Marinobacterium sp. MBR-111]|jgi:hypothetical protein|uniref:hypothetical protein n=1 Tax=Marinobacterium sp. MBR-111 TaxID=3156463 RepID=UPI0033956A12
MARRYLDNYTVRITTASVSTGATTFDVDTPPPALAAGDYYEVTLTDSLDAPTKTENVYITGVSGSTLTVLRDVSGTGAQSWVADDYVDLRPTASAFEVIDGVLLKDYTEYTGTASATLNRSAGGWQILPLTAATTINVSGLTSGQSVTVTVTGGNTYGLGYTGVGRWSGNGQPQELKAKHDLQFSHNGVEVVAFDLGGAD